MTNQEALDKVAKLLRLSKSNVPAEAALAMAKAQEIIDKHKLDISSIDFESQEKQRDAEQVKDFGYEDPLEDVRVHGSSPWMLRLTTIVARANGCKGIHTRYDSLGDGKPRGAKVKIVGFPSDVATTRYMYGFLKAEVIRLCNENCQGNSATYKRQFCIGVTETIAITLKKQKEVMHQELRQEQSTNPLALVRLNNAIAKIEARKVAVDTWCNEHFNLGVGSGIRGSMSSAGQSARTHGRIVGSQVRIGVAKASIGHVFKQLS